MRRTYPLCRLSPEAAGQLVRDHGRLTKRLAEAERFNAELQRQIRNTLGTEGLWSLQRAARQAIALQQLQEEQLAS